MFDVCPFESARPGKEGCQRVNLSLPYMVTPTEWISPPGRAYWCMFILAAGRLWKIRFLWNIEMIKNNQDIFHFSQFLKFLFIFQQKMRKHIKKFGNNIHPCPVGQGDIPKCHYGPPAHIQVYCICLLTLNINSIFLGYQDS